MIPIWVFYPGDTEPYLGDTFYVSEIYRDAPDLNSDKRVAVVTLRSTIDRPKPDWSQAPEWATWAIINETFSLRWCSYNWLFLENEPELRHNMWRFETRWEHGSSVDLPLGIDHRTLKEKRPE